MLSRPSHLLGFFFNGLMAWMLLAENQENTIVLGEDETQCPDAMATMTAADCAGQGPAAAWSFLTGVDDPDQAFTDRVGAHRDVLKPIGGEVSSGILALGVRSGDPEYLAAPASDDLRLSSSYTIESWVLPTEVQGWKRIVLRWGATSNWSYHLAIHNGTASLYHGQSDETYRSCEGGQVRAGGVYHLVGVARRNEQQPSASKLEVYLNGRLVATSTYDGTLKQPDTEGVAIGDSASAPSREARFRGYVAAVTLWKRALTAEEIQRRAADDEIVSRLTVLQTEIREAARERQQRQLTERSELLEQLDESGIAKVLFAERAPGRDYQGHYYANFGYSCVDPDYWLHGADGGRLLVLDVQRCRLDVLLDDPSGAVRDPIVHYDGDKILFSYRRSETHHYHLYEIKVDGTDLRQLTDGAWDDVEPAYLPDGGIVFCSTRCKRYIGCWLAPSAILFRCDADGENIRMLSSGAFTENTPSVLPDGRVLYTRWEYVNRDAVSYHHLWTMNPDGSGPMVFFGNQQPGSVFIDAKPIPGGNDIVFIDSPGHGRNEHAGRVALFSASAGPNARAAIRHLTQQPVYRDPFPLDAGQYLAARDNQLVVLAQDGSEQVLFEGERMLHEPSVIRPRPPEPIMPLRTDCTQATGTVVLQNAYIGRNMDNVPPGAISKLLILEDLPKPANFHGGGSQPIGHGVTSTLKRILGTVPVESDGSAYFTVPAMRSIYFALLDERDRSIKQMRSFVTLQPGETISCIGCHEPRSCTENMSIEQPILQALTRPPSVIEPIDGIADIPDFPRDVQPILDRHCLRCHNPDRPDGGVSLSGDRGPVYSLAYYELLLFWQVKDTQNDPGHGTGRQSGNDPPFTTYSSASALMNKIEGGHYEVEVSPHEERQLRSWIDAGAQYPGTYAANGSGQIGGCWRSNEPIRVMADDWPETPAAVEAVERRCGACHSPQQLPRHVTARIPLDPWGDMLAWTRPLSRYSRHRLFNLTRPEKSLVLKVALAQTAGGLATERLEEPDADTFKPAPVEDRSAPPGPVRHPIVFLSPADPDYQNMLSHLEAASDKLQEIKRFDMPGFQPNEHYIREMKRYGILPATLDPHRDPVDSYETDQRYWQSMWHHVTEME